MPLLAKHVPEYGRKLIGLERQVDLLGALNDKIPGFSWRRDAGEIAFDIGGEYRNTRPRETLGQDLQRDGLAGARRTGDEAVAVRKPEREVRRQIAFADKNGVFGVAIA